jgi:hypothetical protein
MAERLPHYAASNGPNSQLIFFFTSTEQVINALPESYFPLYFQSLPQLHTPVMLMCVQLEINTPNGARNPLQSIFPAKLSQFKVNLSAAKYCLFFLLH